MSKLTLTARVEALEAAILGLQDDQVKVVMVLDSLVKRIESAPAPKSVPAAAAAAAAPAPVAADPHPRYEGFTAFQVDRRANRMRAADPIRAASVVLAYQRGGHVIVSGFKDRADYQTTVASIEAWCSKREAAAHTAPPIVDQLPFDDGDDIPG